MGFQMACEGSSPVQPSPTSGVTVYEHPDYRGESYTFTGDFHRFDDLHGPCARVLEPEHHSWDDCVSSVKIAAGWTAIAFERDDFGGQTLTITSDVRDLDDVGGPCGGDWDDCISSIRVMLPG
jgi:hypothetical protein